MKQGLGTQLRHLIDLLDGAVSAAYKDAGLQYRPRYTPVVRALIDLEPLTVGQIAEVAGITQPAATQTVALMIKEDILSAEQGAEDGRQRLIRLSKRGRSLLPKLKVFWQATSLAANDLDADLPYPLSELLASAIDALGAKSFAARIGEARSKLAKDTNTSKLRSSPVKYVAIANRSSKSSRLSSSVRKT
jgi:MarR family transcriptional regulator, organic hydroperoxide resistance regulator